METTLQQGYAPRIHSEQLADDDAKHIARHRASWPRAAAAGLTAVALATAVGVGVGAYATIAAMHRSATTIDVVGGPAASRRAVTTAGTRRQPRRHAASRAYAAGIPAPATSSYSAPASGSAATSCGGGLSVGPDTTCGFAENVRVAYERNGPGAVLAYSPATGATYAMSCSTGPSVICTGGNDASVYFSSAVSVSPAPANVGDLAGTTACGGGVSVGTNTTCAFAANVQSAYDQNGEGTVTAYSPVTNRTYAMTCLGTAPVVCTGGNDATVYLP